MLDALTSRQTLYDRIAELEEENRQLKAMMRPPTRFAPEWKLSPPEQRVLGLLYDRPAVTRDALEVAIVREGKTSDDYADLTGTANSVLHMLRVKLKRHGIAIGRMRQSGVHLMAEMKARVKAGIVSGSNVAT